MHHRCHHHHHNQEPDPHILLSVLKTIRHIGYNPQKIVSEFSRIKSIRHTEKRLRANCKIFESRMARCQEVLPMSEQIVRLGIGVPELLALHSAVLKKADTDNLSRDRAAYHVIEEIRDYNNLGGMKKQLSDVSLQIFTMNQISARQNNAIMSLARLHAYSITEAEIVNMHNILNQARLGNASRMEQ